MAEIIRNRTIRPSSRLETSKSYKIDTRTVLDGDLLIVNINHEVEPFLKTYRFSGSNIGRKRSISFRVMYHDDEIEIRWSGAVPNDTLTTKPPLTENMFQPANGLKLRCSLQTNLKEKKSFPPISDPDITILILGTMPGDRSWAMNEYYAHPRNKFWKIMSSLFRNDVPSSYTEKITWLLQAGIGVWDAAYSVQRVGSLDNAIQDEIPNALGEFVDDHKHLKVIAFNGAKSEALFNKYFDRKPGIRYVSLPSTSPANARLKFENMLERWKEIVD